MPILDIHALQNDKFLKDRMRLLDYNVHTDRNGLNIENKLKYKGLDVKKLDESNFAKSKEFFEDHYEEVSKSQVTRYVIIFIN